MIYLGDNKARQLFHNGLLTFSQIEKNGIRIDVPYCEKVYDDLGREKEQIAQEILDSEGGKLWYDKYKDDTKFTGNDQLGDVLFNMIGIESTKKTPTGKNATDAKTLEAIDHPLVDKVKRLRKVSKTRDTYIKNLIQETVDGYMHPFFQLHLARTYRSSSSNPNFQNIPIRDPEYAKLIRTAIIPRPGRRIVEIDFSGIEVRVSACYHHDSTMINYIKDKTTDMHRDMAMQCYKVPLDQMNKTIRYCGKNKFVFPAFYGSYYRQIAPDLWKAIDEMKLKLNDGTYLSRHLKNEGVYSFFDFEDHIKDVEKDFWNNRFRVYDKWRKDFYQEYLKNGSFVTKTGFVCKGFMNRNDVLNYPIQGSAFHLLLWSAGEIQKMITKMSLETLIIGQIHDSIIADVPDAEFEVFVRRAKAIMERRIMNVFDWIIVPIEVEVEATDVDDNWFNKKEIKLVA
jgi:DNA polymerase-1